MLDYGKLFICLASDLSALTHQTSLLFGLQQVPTAAYIYIHIHIIYIYNDCVNMWESTEDAILHLMQTELGHLMEGDQYTKLENLRNDIKYSINTFVCK